MGSTGTSLSQKKRKEAAGHPRERQGAKNGPRRCPAPAEKGNTNPRLKERVPATIRDKRRSLVGWATLQ